MLNKDEYQTLEGVRVIEICNVAAGPFCGMLLADMGAEVIKIEPLKGDMLRQWPPITEGFSENFSSLNRNKKSIALNLKDDDDRCIAEELIASADVLIENNRPGVMSRLGLSYDAVSTTNPALVYCSLSAFGQEGPRANEGGFDVTLQAMSGIMSVTGEVEREPAKCGVPVADFSSGLYAAFAVTSMLRQVQNTGQGGYIDVPMLGVCLAISALQTSEYFGTGKDPLPLGSAHPRNAPYQGFRARDKHFVVAAGNNNLWEKLCDVVGLTDLVHDPRFESNTKRAVNQAELKQILEAEFMKEDAALWLQRFEDAGVPCSSINKFSEALTDAQVEYAGWVSDLTMPNGQTTRTFGSPLSINGINPPIRFGPPALDEHRESILAGLRKTQTI